MFPEWADDTFWLTMVGLGGAGCSALLTYFLKSRCVTIDCCCFKCKRDVLHLDANQINVVP